MSTMLPFTGGDDVGAIVTEFGSYTTKMGFAGEDFPRALFRSNIGLLREKAQQQQDGKVAVGYDKLLNMRYDIISKPMIIDDGTDGDWEIYNPIDQTTGLLRLNDNFERNSNYNSNSNNNSQDPSESSSKNALINLIEHGLKSSLGSIDLNSNMHPLLLIDKPYTTPNLRSKITEIIFEEYNIPKYFICRDAVLSCYACGRTTSTVVDIGYNNTVISPVFDGFIENKGIICSKIGGHTMDNYMLSLLDNMYKQQHHQKDIMPLYQLHSKFKKQNQIIPTRSIEFHKLCKLDIARALKENIIVTSSKVSGYDPLDTNSIHANMIKTPMELPDGTMVQVGHERYAPTELLFNSNVDLFTNKRDDITSRANKKRSLYTSNTSTSTSNNNNKNNNHDDDGNIQLKDLSSNPIQNIVCDSVFQCDREQQAQLLGNIVLTGGGSNIPNISDRLRDEVEAIIHKHTPGWRVKVISPGLGGNINSTGNTSTPAVQYSSVTTNNVSAWLGGSILGSLGSFQDMWMTKTEYEEYGSHYINRKCP